MEGEAEVTASSVSWVGRASSAKEAGGGGLGERRSSVCERAGGGLCVRTGSVSEYAGVL